MDQNPIIRPASETDFWKVINGQSPVLFTQMERGFIEAESDGRYSVVGCETVMVGGKPKFIAPQFAEILAKSGQVFELHT